MRIGAKDSEPKVLKGRKGLRRFPAVTSCENSFASYVFHFELFDPFEIYRFAFVFLRESPQAPQLRVLSNRRHQAATEFRARDSAATASSQYARFAIGHARCQYCDGFAAAAWIASSRTNSRSDSLSSMERRAQPIQF